MDKQLGALLRHHLESRHWSQARLSRASGIGTSTLSRWIKGEVESVQSWHQLAAIAIAFDLGREETNTLFDAGGHAPIDRLLAQQLTQEERDLLARWVRASQTYTFQVPVPISQFIGRDDEVNELRALLAEKREVTVVGFGGFGKTRLALEVVRTMRDDFEGAYFVDLAAIRDPAAVVPVIAETVGFRTVEGEPLLRSLSDWLRDARILLVLDNVEQVIDAAEDVATLLRHTTNLKVLVTSRIPIKIRGEQRFGIDPLPIPARDATPAELRQNPAVALFADRARSVDRHFETTVAHLQRIAEICTRLDGLPLAIELAAAQTQDVPLAELLERFPSRLEIAVAGPRDVDARQRTLRATIAWSFALLGEDAQRLCTALGVFVGGFTRDAAMAIAAAVGLTADEAAAAFDSLVVHQFVRLIPVQHAEAAEIDRFGMLETIREFAVERLHLSGEREVIRRAHVAYLLALGERAELYGARQVAWLQRLADERDNVQSALEWCHEHQEWEIGLRLSLANVALWQLRQPAMESFARLEQFLAPASEGEITPLTRARALLYQGTLLLRATGDVDAASRRFDEALAVFRDHGNLDGQCKTLQAIGDADRHRREWSSASERYQESLALALEIDSAYLVAHAYMGLTFCAQELPGGMAEAEAFCAQTLEWAERSQHGATIAQAANSMGEMARYRRDWKAALAHYDHALAMANAVSGAFRVAMVLHNLGYAALGLGDRDLAQLRFEESYRLYQRMRDWRGQAECLAGFANVALAAGAMVRAARLCGASQAIFDTLGGQLDTMDQADFDRTIAALRDHLGAEFDKRVAEGRTMQAETLIA